MLRIITNTNIDDDTMSYIRSIKRKAEKRSIEVTIESNPKEVLEGSFYLIMRECVDDLSDKFVKGVEDNPLIDLDGVISSKYSLVSRAVINTVLEIDSPGIGNYVVIGRSEHFGNQVKSGIMNFCRHAELLGVIHSKTDTGRRENLIRNADVIISTVGFSRLHQIGLAKDGSSLINSGQYLIDGGIHIDKYGDISGDFTDEAKAIAAYSTPVPGKDSIGNKTVELLLDTYQVCVKAQEK